MLPNFQVLPPDMSKFQAPISHFLCVIVTNPSGRQKFSLL